LVKFLSDEWIETAKNSAVNNLDSEKDLKNATASLLNVVNNIPPEGKTIYFYLSVKNGKLAEMAIDQSGSLIEKNAEFVVACNYDTFVQIVKGEMNTMIALIKNRVQIKGDKKKALQFVKPIEKINECFRKIETEF